MGKKGGGFRERGSSHVVKLMVSGYSTDLQVKARTRLLPSQHGKTTTEVYIFSNNGHLKMFYEKGNAFSTFILPQRYTQSALVRKSTGYF